MKTTIIPLKHSLNLVPFRLVLPLIPILLACFALSPTAYATCQRGCLTDGNTVLGDDALINNSEVGSSQTALGFQALFSNTQGFNNTATGYQALFNNTLDGTTRLSVTVRSITTQVASTIQPSGLVLSSVIPGAFLKRPSAHMHSPKIRPAMTTPPLVIIPFGKTQLAV